ncbi:MAG: M14 family metallopeptidase [Bacteriovoracia bacterium]
MLKLSLAIVTIFTFLIATARAETNENEMQWVSIRAKDKTVRSAIVNEGVSIETQIDGISYGFGTLKMIESLKAKGFEVLSYFPESEIRTEDFPSQDSQFHNYAEMNEELDALEAKNPTLVHSFTIGRTVEGKFIRGIRINPHATDGLTPSGLPGMVLIGAHHAREHLSVEVPILFAKYLVEKYDTDRAVRDLLDRRDFFVIPMLNVDGAEYDIASGSYKMWRKNRVNPTARCAGTDLNRNYGFKWGTGGSSSDTCSDIYMGPKAFSEPETIAVKNFVEGHPNLKVLLTLHSYSELVLYPWGYTNDPIANAADHDTFKKMATTMAGWNGYTPEQSSDLYITSGDTTDWAYGTLGIFAFTFELTPKDQWGGGGFYPGVGAIQSTFQANVKPMLYMLDLADDPHRATLRPETTLFYGQ